MQASAHTHTGFAVSVGDVDAEDVGVGGDGGTVGTTGESSIAPPPSSHGLEAAVEIV